MGGVVGARKEVDPSQESQSPDRAKPATEPTQTPGATRRPMRKWDFDASSRGSRITKTRHGSGDEEGERDKEDGKRKTALSHGRW